MPRTVPILAGVIIVSTVAYKLREHMITSSDDITQRLGYSKSKLDQASVGRSFLGDNAQLPSSLAKPASILMSPHRYVSDRLVPAVKDNWNHQVGQAAHSLMRLDLGNKTHKLWKEKILGDVEK